MVTDFIRTCAVGYVRKQPKAEQYRLRERVFAFQTGPFGWFADMLCGLLFGSNLKMLATIYMTDKWNHHWYAQHYEEILKQDRHKKINILEIGVGGYDNPRMGGNSLRMWSTFFPKGHVYGVDIYDKSPHDRRRIRTFC